uniref:Phosphatidic acid phosphatase type 2/haloperoxidase domain-containing protein n=1 Tax=Aureoumbra lagunensis TaxID=44058 RepID=A0A7S3K4D7_9STRA|mmetsp:Transcript_22763/g.29474  ORF Transcript_22763/g.29474 Transcript_22763/m.29474 type:complete len:226 (-) Transcript_22763:977-1654(-)
MKIALLLVIVSPVIGIGRLPAALAVISPRSTKRRTVPCAIAIPSGGAALEQRPTVASVWGVAGVVAMLMNAVKRVLPVALEPFRTGSPLGAKMWCTYAAFAAVMGYVEGYKSFHKKFSPLVAARSMTLQKPHPFTYTLFAPFYAMGLFHATPKRRATSWGFLIGVFALVKIVKQFSYPWRSIVDGGVVVGLTIGSASIIWHYAREINGIPAPADPSLPAVSSSSL